MARGRRPALSWRGEDASPLEAETGLLGERAVTGPLGVGRRPAPAGGQAGSHGGAARIVMWSSYSTPWHDTTSKGSMPSHSGIQRLFIPEIGRRYMESCAILVAQRMSPPRMCGRGCRREWGRGAPFPNILPLPENIGHWREDSGCRRPRLRLANPQKPALSAVAQPLAARTTKR